MKGDPIKPFYYKTFLRCPRFRGQRFGVPVFGSPFLGSPFLGSPFWGSPLLGVPVFLVPVFRVNVLGPRFIDTRLGRYVADDCFSPDSSTGSWTWTRHFWGGKILKSQQFGKPVQENDLIFFQSDLVGQTCIGGKTISLAVGGWNRPCRTPPPPHPLCGHCTSNNLITFS